MSNRLTVAQTAKEIGCCPHLVRLNMQRGIWDLGEVVTPEQSGTMLTQYYIFRNKLNKFLGEEVAK